MKRTALYFALSAVCCVIAWRIAPLLVTSRAKVTQGPQVPAGSVLVNVSMVGFDPASIETKAGQPLRLAFYRPNASNCASEVIFPDLGVRKELPPGQTTVVDVTPPKNGTFAFMCGMKMLKGKLIVR